MKIAETVKVRPKRFEVDGEDFPWYISQRGAEVMRVDDDLYTVRVEIFLLDKVSRAAIPFLSEDGMNSRVPQLGGVEFPWEIINDGYTYACGPKLVPTLTLSFYVKSADTGDEYIEDAREHFNVSSELIA